MKCPDCGKPFEIGWWPLCEDSSGKHGHTPPRGMMTFKPYIDTSGTGKEIRTWAEHQARFKPRWVNDNIERLESRDKPDVYYRELSERRMERRQEAIREGRVKA